jgi:hypothetical protein
LNQYDATLKLLFQGSATGALSQLIGVAIERWLNVELPRVQSPRVDLLGETHETWEEKIEEEVKRVPVLNDILENKVLGREYRGGVEEGVLQGVQQGIQQGELTLLRRQIERRFGTLPEWAEARLSASSPSEIEVFGLRLLDAESLEDLFR